MEILDGELDLQPFILVDKPL